jgi:pimeloyl-ACP methyl ester carboxylesterase
MTISVYFHGQPGAPHELADLGLGQYVDPARFWAPDRTSYGRSLTQAEVLDQLAADILARAQGQPIRLIGFSLGAFIATEIAWRLLSLAPGQPCRLDLISPAAPLPLGDFLDHMAGGPVFRLAQGYKRLFRVLTAAQSLVAQLAPGLLYRQLFSSAAGADIALSKDPQFRVAIFRLFEHSLKAQAFAYRREILSFIGQDPSRLKAVTSPVAIWQGLEDNWTPPAMADALAKALPNVASYRRLVGLSHFSTLFAAIPEIFADDAHQTMNPPSAE